MSINFLLEDWLKSVLLKRLRATALLSVKTRVCTLTSAVSAFTLHANSWIIVAICNKSTMNFNFLHSFVYWHQNDLNAGSSLLWWRMLYLHPVACAAFPLQASFLAASSSAFCRVTPHVSFSSRWCTQFPRRTAPVPAQRAAEVSIATPSLRLMLHCQALAGG